MERRASFISLLQVLSELVEFMSDPYARRKDHQKLVRNLGVSRIVLLLNLYIIYIKAWSQPQIKLDGIRYTVCT